MKIIFCIEIARGSARVPLDLLSRDGKSNAVIMRARVLAFSVNPRKYIESLIHRVISPLSLDDASRNGRDSNNNNNNQQHSNKNNIFMVRNVTKLIFSDERNEEKRKEIGGSPSLGQLNDKIIHSVKIHQYLLYIDLKKTTNK